MGLLGDSFDDPQTQAVMQLAAGLLGPGSFGQALGAGMRGFNESKQSNADLKLKGAQLTQAQQAAALQALQIEQQTRMFNLQTPFLEEALRRMQGQPQAAPQGPSVMAGAPGTTPPSSPASPMNPAAPQPAARSGSMFPGVPDSVAMGMIGAGGFAKLPEAIQKYNEPTDFLKMLSAAGIDPNSPIGRQLIQGNLAKTNYVAPVNARPGAIGRDPFTNRPVFFNPHVPEGGTPVFDASGNVAAINSLPGATGVIGDVAAAKTAGEGTALPYSGFTASGTPAPLTSRTAAVAGTPPQTPPQAPQAPTRTTPQAELLAIKAALPLMTAERAKMDPGPDRDALDREINRNQNALLSGKPYTVSTTASPLYGAAPPGTEANAKNNANEISKKWQAQVEANQQAQTTNSYLDSIEQLSKTAQSGPFSDRIALANALLAPISEERANALTAKQLLDKYHSQIVARLGQGGLATDAARAIIDAAYPNSHMTPEAIGEASANLRGANNMIQARTKLLQPIAADRAPEANGKYDAQATQFDQVADPRIFQLKNMSADAAKKYLSAMPPAVQADLRTKAAKLKAMGAL